MKIIPNTQIMTNTDSSLGFTAFFNMISDGRLSVVTAIMNESTVPSCAPLANSASATGIVPKISAYIGTPTSVAKITPKGLLLPKTVSIQLAGISSYGSTHRCRPPAKYKEIPFSTYRQPVLWQNKDAL